MKIVIFDTFYLLQSYFMKIFFREKLQDKIFYYEKFFCCDNHEDHGGHCKRKYINQEMLVINELHFMNPAPLRNKI